MAQIIDLEFRKNFHYDYCRKLGQLKPLKIFYIRKNARQVYIDECIRRGQRLGDIKMTILHLQNGWNKVFEGDYI
jgi:hypothetical protein